MAHTSQFFWSNFLWLRAELYDGAKLFYLSGLQYGLGTSDGHRPPASVAFALRPRRYHRLEVQNLARFIAVPVSELYSFCWSSGFVFSVFGKEGKTGRKIQRFFFWIFRLLSICAAKMLLHLWDLRDLGFWGRSTDFWRFLEVQKAPLLSWRQSHPYVLALRWGP